MTPSRPPVGRPALLVAVAVLAVALGLAAGRLGFAAFAFQGAVLTVVTGWVVVVCGLVAWWRVPDSRVGALLVAAGLASYLGWFDHVGAAWLADLATWSTWLFVAILAHAVLTYPEGRVHDSRLGILIVVGYVLALLPMPAQPLAPAVWIAVAVALRRLRGRPDPRRGPADRMGLLLALGLAAGPVLGPVLAPGIVDLRSLRLVAIAATALVLTADRVRMQLDRVRMTDLVLRLDGGGPASLATELRRATGDATLEVAFWVPERAAWVDSSGRAVVLPTHGPTRTVTRLERGDGRPVVLVHDRAVEADAALLEAVSQASALSSANAALQADLRAQVEDVRASRLRILQAAAAERSALRRRLDASLGPRLERADELLSASTMRDPTVEAARQELAGVKAELARLAEGLHPLALESGGLAGALRALVDRSRISVRLHLGAVPPTTPATASTIYFVCAEALANVAKHASARTASVDLGVAGDRIRLEVADDGVGMDTTTAGSGIGGMRDRVEALGGQLRIVSSPEGGTRLSVALPVGQA
jgi:signal transduction histidine kinase